MTLHTQNPINTTLFFSKRRSNFQGNKSSQKLSKLTKTLKALKRYEKTKKNKKSNRNRRDEGIKTKRRERIEDEESDEKTKNPTRRREEHNHQSEGLLRGSKASPLFRDPKKRDLDNTRSRHVASLHPDACPVNVIREIALTISTILYSLICIYSTIGCESILLHILTKFS